MTIEEIFADVSLAWGKKYAPEMKLVEVWKIDRDYLLWGSNLTKNKTQHTLPPQQYHLVHIAHTLQNEGPAAAKKLLGEFHIWEKIALRGEGLEDLPRPSTSECRKLIKESTILCGHHDLDGIYSLAAAISKGGALSTVSKDGKIPFNRLRLFGYNIRGLEDYTQNIRATKNDVVVIIDYAAHPAAALNLDHHSTCLSYWPFGTELPIGVFDTAMPSCPRLLAVHCGLDIPEEVLSGSDMVDGARYQSVEQASDLENPFVALEFALSVDVSDVVAKKVVITLAENDLDPFSVLGEDIWDLRVQLVAKELAEQRSYWSKGQRFDTARELLAVADARQAPYSASRFRYLPFENGPVAEKPYLITLRSSYRDQVNLGVSRNPFYSKPKFFLNNPLDLGVLAKSIGQGGGRKEAASVNIPASSMAATVDFIAERMELSASSHSKK